ncbi:RNA recognition motif-containing protein [Besnoitia besnoiti]|uniref:RNA recognition motif-containing protein n=1 Tax=Besnoitia besnoiti TaxID=94643 RepID=A0A2A9MNQ7_BESBE|nr:RNA recognition motif-containing protein [Besnoitia besnoiti]PFH37360.1 RNA recognition motif-containing protein [Besnoitia besnoiti]
MFVPGSRRTDPLGRSKSSLASLASPPRKKSRNGEAGAGCGQQGDLVTAPYALFADEESVDEFYRVQEEKELEAALQQQHVGVQPSQNPRVASSVTGAEENPECRSILVTHLPISLDTDTLKLRLEELFTNEISKILSETPYYCNAPSCPPQPGEPQLVKPEASDKYANSRVVHPRHLVNLEVLDVPFAVCGVRVAKPTKAGHLSYAVIDFASPKLMQTALEFFGATTVLPGTFHHIHLNPYRTWAAPVPVDEYHLYISGLKRDTTDADVLEVLKSLGTEVPRSIKVIMDAKCRYNRCLGFAFLRFNTREAADRALQILEARGPSLGLMARRVYVPPNNRRVTRACSGSIFLANLPADATKDELRTLFSSFGDVRSVVTHNQKRIAFLEFNSHESALAAITHMQGYKLRFQSLACAWSVRRHTTYQEEGIEEDEGYRQSEEVCAFAYEAAKSLEPIIPRHQRNRHNTAGSCTQSDCKSPSSCAGGAPNENAENDMCRRSSSAESDGRQSNSSDLSAQQQLYWLSFYAADPTVCARKLIEAMNGTRPSGPCPAPAKTSET